MTENPIELVRSGYDRMADRFVAWRAGIEGSPELEWVDALLGLLPPRPDVLELACGVAPEPTLLLAGRGSLVGVDISTEQLRRARERCPNATFLEGDMTEIELEPESFDAVVCIYAFNHVPRSGLPPLLGRIPHWLRPGGYLLATFGVSGGEGVEDDWLGVPMFFASYTERENIALVSAGGLKIERNEVVQLLEPEGEARFQWLLARRPSS